MMKLMGVDGVKIHSGSFVHIRHDWSPTKFVYPFHILTFSNRSNLLDSPKIYPLLLAYSTAALVTTITYMIIAYTAPSITDPTLDATARFHAMSEKGRWTILNATMPFLIIPAVMWIDMMVRLGHLVNAGVKAQKGKVNESKKL